MTDWEGHNAPPEFYICEVQRFMDRVRITNTSQHDVGLVNQNGVEYNIRPGTFIALTKDDVEYMVAIAPKLFASAERAAELRIDNEELAKDMNIAAPGDPTPADESVIRKALGGNLTQLRKYVSNIEDPYLIEAIYQTALKMDLPQSKMNILREVFPQKFIND